ncbi:HupE/UreJ family protein [Mesorhizobium sp. M2E.F.Ca.ET.209.01.1.1]|uniref:HupE/UreJ family protein n=1 Tax=Mesorhizobium sp. M2E.F.Ca.ET.209.01.1.1 TaxID=2500526 RepID=UPI000FDB6BC6|nr:HupE/UreJ family protein [Mesorhizobium sp. M2E.F.Ca.ET.209.01.1.1]TGS09653.1 HupE/UreJ family protein [Mesorhizobium sp. M2E.F.Ca.ET.209.01.1.1]
MFKRLLCLLTATIATTVPAFAHVGVGSRDSFITGFMHPLSGLDHIVVMVAVGLWAATLGGRALWLVPTAFIASMTLGYVLSLAGTGFPVVEHMVLASVIAVGILIAASVRLPATAGAMLVGAFALFHGAAHSGELGAANSLGFGVGFIIATALLHAAGIGVRPLFVRGIGLERQAADSVTRLLGAVAAALGALAAFGAV